MLLQRRCPPARVPHSLSVATLAPPIEVAFPDLGRWAPGNSGIPYVWTFAGTGAGPHVLIQALTHGNEVCGAIALDRNPRANCDGNVSA